METREALFVSAHPRVENTSNSNSRLYDREGKMCPAPSDNNTTALADDVRPREVVAWAMYDFANSGFTTVVITAIFNAYFVRSVAGNAPWATFAWTAALSVSYLAIILIGPALGAYADQRAAKKPLLAITTLGCVAFTAALAWVQPGDLWLGIGLLIMANFFFGAGENLIAAFLPELARGKSIGRISGWGWSLGYLGGLLCLGACLAYVTAAQARGESSASFVPVTMLITAAIFLVASLPTFLILRERAIRQPGTSGIAITDAFARLGRTIREVGRYRDLAWFLGCIVFYQAGVQTVVTLAAVYAELAMGFSTQDTITLILAVNVAAALGALTFGEVQDRLGHIRTIAFTILGWIATIIIAWYATSRPVFWVAATLAGICLGSSQSAGRALVGYLSPEHRRAEFFGLWGFAVKLANILGPITYGVATWITGGNHRAAMLVTGIFFVIGLAILRKINVERGHTAARMQSDP